MFLLAYRPEIGDYRFVVGGYRWGFYELRGPVGRTYSQLDVGPLGSVTLPVSALQGWAILVMAVALILAMVAWAGHRRRRRSLADSPPHST